jgi:hypothetical protein
VINTGANSSSRLILSRSRNLQDSVTELPELGAQFYIQNSSGASFQLYYYSSGAMVITHKECLDCRYQGGTIVTPAFWQ